MSSEKDPLKVKAGQMRGKALSPEKRTEIARNAALSRWEGDLPTATHEGEFKIVDSVISCAVLPNGQRIITQATFLRALGRSRSPKAGTGVLSTVDGVPFFLQAEALKPFISEDLLMSTSPVFYRTKGGGRGVGYDARIMPKVAEVYLRLRDDSLAKTGEMPARYARMIIASDVLMRGLANVGIIALVDEATGFQADRARDALEKILEEFIAKELKPWVHTFPVQFYQELFRLRNVPFRPESVKKPRYFGHLTNNIIYARLAPNVLEELKKATPRDSKGRHKHQLHRRLTQDIGHPKLREHISAVVSLMKISDNYTQFEGFLNRAHPKYDETLPLPFGGPEPETGI